MLDLLESGLLAAYLVFLLGVSILDDEVMAAPSRLPASIVHRVDVGAAVLIVAVLHASALAVPALLLESVGYALGHWLLVWSAVVFGVFGISKAYVLIFKLLLHELFGIVQLWELDLLLLDDEGWQLPPPFLIVPVCLLFDLGYLIITQDVANYLV